MPYTITLNQQFNSLEVKFDGIPEKQIRETLKSLKFRWNPKKSVWYGYAQEEDLKTALEGGKVATEKVVKEKKSLKDYNHGPEVMEKFREELKKTWNDEHMVDYCFKKASQVVELSTGLYEIEKKSIETRFCFGHGYCGRTTPEEEDRAHNMAAMARSSEDYFTRENMSYLEETLTALKEGLEEYEHNWADHCYFGLYTARRYEKTNIVYILTGNRVRQTIGYEFNSERAERYFPGFQQLTKEDVQKLIDAYEVEKQKRQQQITTYLKRYGLSKVYSWTYLSD